MSCSAACDAGRLLDCLSCGWRPLLLAWIAAAVPSALSVLVFVSSTRGGRSITAAAVSFAAAAAAFIAAAAPMAVVADVAA